MAHCSPPAASPSCRQASASSDRAAAVGAWSGLGGVAGAVGPFVGGGLVDGPGWRWAFLINVPVAVVVVVCARAAVPETRDTHAAKRLDSRGAIYAVIGLAAGTWALTEAGQRGWGDRVVLAALAGSVVFMTSFVFHVRRSHDPVVPPALFRNRTFTVVNLGTVFVYAAIGLAFFLVAYQLQVAAGWTALSAGLALLPTTLLMLVLSARSARARPTDRSEAPTHRRPTPGRRRPPVADPHRLTSDLDGRCAPGCARPRSGARHLRRPTHRHGHGGR